MVAVMEFQQNTFTATSDDNVSVSVLLFFFSFFDSYIPFIHVPKIVMFVFYLVKNDCKNMGVLMSRKFFATKHFQRPKPKNVTA